MPITTRLAGTSNSADPWITVLGKAGELHLLAPLLASPDGCMRIEQVALSHTASPPVDVERHERNLFVLYRDGTVGQVAQRDDMNYWFRIPRLPDRSPSANLGCALLLVSGAPGKLVSVCERGLTRWSCNPFESCAWEDGPWVTPIIAAIGKESCIWTLDSSGLSFWKHLAKPKGNAASLPTWRCALDRPPGNIRPVWAHSLLGVLALVDRGSIKFFDGHGLMFVVHLHATLPMLSSLCFVSGVSLALGYETGEVQLLDWAVGHETELVTLAKPSVEGDAVLAMTWSARTDLLILQESGTMSRIKCNGSDI